MLSTRDRDHLLSYLKDAPEPNEALKIVFEKVSRLCRVDENGRTVYKLDEKFIKNENENEKK